MEIANDQYWLQYAKSSIQSAISSRNEGAARLERMVLWFWGLYTASFTIGVSINAIEAPIGVLILLASPVVLLIFSYWLCIRAQLPVDAQFDPRIPSEIRAAYNAGTVVKARRFNLAVASTFISALLLAIALFSLSFVQKKSAYSVNAMLNEKKDELIITGLFPKQAVVKTVVDSVGPGGKNLFYKNTYKVQDNGILNLNVPITTMPIELIIVATWTDNGTEKGFVQKIKRQ